MAIDISDYLNLENNSAYYEFRSEGHSLIGSSICSDHGQ